MKSSGLKLERLEAVRGFAAFYVCLGHVILAGKHEQWVSFPFRFGQEAVMAFFVLSGFVIALTTNEIASVADFFNYLLKRALRIYTVWIPMVAILWLANRFSPEPAMAPTSWQFIGNLLMLQDFSSVKPAVICDPIWANTPLWSLHYEWWFYMLFPGVLLIPERLRLHVIGSASVLSSIIYIVCPNPLSRILFYFITWWIGVQAASTWRRHGLITFKSMFVPLLYVVLSAAPPAFESVRLIWNRGHVNPGVHPVLEVRHLFAAIGVSLLALAWHRIRWIGFGWTIGPFKYLAPISFSLYVFHYRTIAYANYIRTGSQFIDLVIDTVITLIVCIMIELLLYPSLRRLARRGPSIVRSGAPQVDILDSR